MHDRKRASWSRKPAIPAGCLLTAILSAVVYCTMRAEEQTPQPAPSTERAGVLVLKNGKLVEGEITQSAGGYVVKRKQGEYVVPFDLARFTARDRHDAYVKVAATLDNPLPTQRLSVARWCLTWQLYEEARSELRQALIEDPKLAAARTMLVQLEEILHPDRNAEDSIPQPKKTIDGFQRAERKSLAGLSREAAIEFTTKVQPILVNRCANAGCHGGGEIPFHLIRVRSGFRQNRVYTERNLASVMNYVDKDQPANSELLTVLDGSHGRGGRPALTGPAARRNRETLQAWAALLGDPPEEARERALAEARTTTKDGRPAETLIQGRPNQPQDTLTPAEQAAREQERLVQSLVNNERLDAFDPEEFNRKVHGRTSQ